MGADKDLEVPVGDSFRMHVLKPCNLKFLPKLGTFETMNQLSKIKSSKILRETPAMHQHAKQLACHFCALLESNRMKARKQEEEKNNQKQVYSVVT